MLNSKKNMWSHNKPLHFAMILLAISMTIFTPMSLFASGAVNISVRDQLIAREGNSEEGKKLFWSLESKVACAKCHAVDGKGGKVGPDLSSVGSTRPVKYIMESILSPSAVIVKGYDPILIQLHSGTRITGFLKKETLESLTVTLANGTMKEFARADIKRSKVLKKSTMPGNFADLLSDEEFANLIAYVQALKGSAIAKTSEVKTRTKKEKAHSAKVYKLYCTQCHGANANGKGINAPHLSIQPKNHSNSKEMGSLTDEGIFLAIKKGGVKVGRSSEMPPFGGALSDDEITGLVGHLRKLCNC